MTALVTGAAGFIGSHLVDALLFQGQEVIGIDNLSIGRTENLAQALQSKKFRFIHGDINDQAIIRSACEGVEHVYHLAGLADIVPSMTNPAAYFQANVNGTFSVVEAAKAAKVGKFIYAASSSCYGLPDIFPTPETAPISPQYPYALTKRLGEEIALHWGQVYRIPTLSLRFFNVYGPRARTSGTYGAVFGVFLAQKLAGLPFTVVGDGRQTRDFTYVSDVVAALLRAADCNVSNEIINIGSGGTYSINSLIALLGGAVVSIPKRPGEPDCTYADVTKAQRLLNWKAEIPFAEGVARLLQTIGTFADAPLWTADSIAEATSSWFSYLEPQVQSIS